MATYLILALAGKKDGDFLTRTLRVGWTRRSRLTLLTLYMDGKKSRDFYP